MKYFVLLAVYVSIGLAVLTPPVIGQETATIEKEVGKEVVAQESPEQRDARVRWWREARFGKFVHWGLYSGLAGTWKGKMVGKRGGMEWLQNRVGANTDEYAKEAKPHFKPTKDFAQHGRSWPKSRLQYLVFTTKHHEGFSSGFGPLVRQAKSVCSIQLKGIEHGKCSFAMKRSGRCVWATSTSKPHLAKMSAVTYVNSIRPRYPYSEVASLPEMVKPTHDVKQRAFAAS